MILLDTHIWIWWVSQPDRLSPIHARLLEAGSAGDEGVGVSIISCWEAAKLVEYRRLRIDRPLSVWLDDALSLPAIRVLPLSTRIVVESTQLPGAFHKDPADQMIVATARVLGCALLTEDSKIRAYPHVDTP